VPEITLTRADVVEAAGCDPWELAREFHSDTSVEQIDGLAGIFRNGAAEADDAGAVAQYASSLEERAGTRGSNAIYADGAEHLTQTYEDLGAENLENVSRVLTQVATEADSVLESNEDAIRGPAGLDWLIGVQETAANDEYTAFDTWLTDQDPGGQGDSRLFTYEIHGERFTGTKPTFPKDEVRSRIREYRLGEAADGVSASYETMFDDVDGYYGMLHTKEGELAEYGYDVSDSPLNFWHTEGRAEHEAEQLERLLAQDNPDPEELARYTAGAGALADGVHANGEELTAAERAYLQAYFGTLEDDDLAALGHLSHASDPERFAGSQENVANAVNALMDPAAGGLDPEADAADVPASIRALTDGGLLHDDMPGVEAHDRVAHYNGLGALMAQATMPPGDVFGQQVASAALDIQHDYELAWLRNEDFNFLEGSSQMLDMVATNPEAAALTLADPDRADRLAALAWGLDDGESAGAFVRAATIPPDGTEPTRAQLDAAESMLTVVSGDTETALADGPATDAVTSAVLDTGLRYFDFLAYPGSDDGTVRNLLGEEVPGFSLGEDANTGFFSFVAEQDGALKDGFYGGVNLHTYQRTADAFESGADMEEFMEDLSRLHGSLDFAEYNQVAADVEGRNQAAEQVRQNWTNGFAIAKDVSAAISLNPATAVAGGVGSLVLSGLERAVVGAPEPPEDVEGARRDASYEDALAEGGEARYWMAQAAADTGVPGADPATVEELAALRADGDSGYLPDLRDLEQAAGYRDQVEDYWEGRRTLAGA
jgi:hypothetical protein